MISLRLIIMSVPLVLLMLATFRAGSAGLSPAPAGVVTTTRIFAGKGVVRETSQDAKIIVIRHEAISNYMAAMTMPFKVKDAGEISGVRPGDEITFQLHVAENESWVDGIVKIGTNPLLTREKPSPNTPPTRPDRALLDYKFTNELGQAVSLNDFRGQALAITFFYTRCPLPDYCPRLSKNFQSASRKLAAMTNGPANWHFISVSFDPTFDSPAMLRAYGQSYGYDPAHWSFLTGPADKIAELAHSSGVHYQFADGAINHDFRTLIVDACGRLQMVFPTSGDLSDQIVAETLKAAAATNQPTPNKAAGPVF
jgi:protein SCO1/2